ncbi:MAG TPA: PAS domain S-box protein, partial [Ktedonobacterales bacterium]|nr:PAS domain S-box protein [Ktedonobacterales bacterium]
SWLDTATQLSGSLWWMTDNEGLVAGERALSVYTGLPEVALTGAGWLAAVAPDDRAALSKRWQVARGHNAPIETSCRFIRADGQYAWLSVRSLPLPPALDAEPRRLWIAIQSAQERAVRNIGYYRALFEQTTQGIMLVGAQGLPLRVNTAGLSMLGLSFAQTRGEAEPPAGWRITREDGERIEAPFREIAAATTSGQATHTFWQVIADDWPGSRWLSVTGSPVIRPHAQARQRTMIFLTDVTDRVRHREAMQSLAAKSTDELTSLRAALDRMADAFVVLDYDGRFTYVNARAREQFAPSGQTLLGRRFWEVFPSLMGTNMEAQYHRILREKTPNVAETLVDGRTWYETRSYPAADGISVYIRDITNQKRTLDELDTALARERDARAEAEGRAKQLDAVFEAVSDGMLVFGADGTVLRANQAMRDLMTKLGHSLSLPMTASPLQDLRRHYGQEAGGSDQPAGLPLERILAGESLTGDRTMDVQLRTPDGQSLYLNISGAPIIGSDGSIQGAVESLRDVTAKRESEQERSRTMSLVAHELRTPLTAIKLSNDLSLRRAKKGVPVDAATLEVAASSILQLERMVNDLVDAARAERENMAMAFERCDVGELAKEAVTEQEATTDKPILFEPPQTPLPVLADRARVRQVLTNLLSNAVKYSPPETPVALRVEARDGSVWLGVS